MVDVGVELVVVAMVDEEAPLITIGLFIFIISTGSALAELSV